MEQRIIFKNKLEELTKAAEAAGGVLQRSQIEKELAGALSPEQMELVFQYLEQQKILIEGWSQDTKSRLAGRRALSLEEGVEGLRGKSEGPEEMEEDAISVLEQYLEEIEALGDVQTEEKGLWLSAALGGDTKALEMLAKAYLPMVCDLAGEFEKDAAMPVEDLVQEGNIALWMALGDLEDVVSVAALEAKLMNAVSTRMEEVLKEELDESDTDQAMVKKVNRLSEAIRSLESDLERNVSIEELSAFLEMPVSQIEDILQLAGDELKIKE